jgi:hypothetical protein
LIRESTKDFNILKANIIFTSQKRLEGRRRDKLSNILFLAAAPEATNIVAFLVIHEPTLEE